jgi:hypothetical protein
MEALDFFTRTDSVLPKEVSLAGIDSVILENDATGGLGRIQSEALNKDEPDCFGCVASLVLLFLVFGPGRLKFVTMTEERGWSNIAFATISWDCRT